MELSLQIAHRSQIKEICDLVNLAYRGNAGWTKETDIVEGNRATLKEIEALILNEQANLLVASMGSRLISCVCIKKEHNSAHIGLFAVHPELQGRGIGNTILSLAEKYALEELEVSKFVMIVVSQRPELISYYERRGYVRTGNVEKYPTHLDVGIPKIKGLTVEYLEKHA